MGIGVTELDNRTPKPDSGGVPVIDASSAPSAAPGTDPSTDPGPSAGTSGSAPRSRTGRPPGRPRTVRASQDTVGSEGSLVDGLSAAQIFGESAAPRTPKPREIKPLESISQMVNMPFAASGLMLYVLGQPALAERMPLSSAEEKQLTDSIYTALKGNPKLMHALEKASGNISLVGLAMSLGTVMAPRIVAIQETYSRRVPDDNGSNPTPTRNTGQTTYDPDPVPRTGGGAEVAGGTETNNAPDNEYTPRVTGNVSLLFSPSVSGKG